MRGRWLAVIAVASLILNVAVVGSFVFLRVRHPLGPRHPLRGFRPAMRHVADSLLRESRPEMERLMIEGERLRAEMSEEIVRPDYDERRLDSLCQEAGRLHGRMTALAYRNARRIAAALPEAERRRFLENMRHRNGPRMRRGGRGPAPCCPPPPGPGLPPSDDSGE
jgi:uncharacterized membrane protein